MSEERRIWSADKQAQRILESEGYRLERVESIWADGYTTLVFRRGGPVGQYAFWNYDHFPYLLGGQITKIREGGAVQTVEYGQGNWFHPVTIRPLAKGKAIMAKLKELEIARKTGIAIVDRAYLSELNKLLEHNGMPRKP